jgi:hypothetical protein
MYSEFPVQPAERAQPEVPPRKAPIVDLREATTLLILFGCFFALFQVSFACQPIRFHPRWTNFFGADSMEGLWTGVDIGSPIAKHPLYAIATRPMYYVATWLYSPGSSNQRANLALAFPGAVLGGLNVALSFWIFRRTRRDTVVTWLFVLLYGFSSSLWVFASFPETYVMTALCTNLFLAGFVAKRTAGRTLGLSALNALACFASPQQVLLATIPCVNHMQRARSPREVLKGIGTYVAALTGLFVIPYELFLGLSRFGWNFPQRYATEYVDLSAATDRHWAFHTVVSMLVFPLAAPPVNPERFGNPSLPLLWRAPFVWWLAAVAFAATAVIAARGLTRDFWRQSSETSRSLAAFVLAYMAFFLIFNPGEAFLYSLPLLLPWLLLIYVGIGGRRPPAVIALVTVLVAATVINNALLIQFLRTLIEFRY